MPTQLPGVIALIQAGFEIYKKQFKVILSISLIQAVFVAAFVLSSAPFAVNGAEVKGSSLVLYGIGALILCLVLVINAFALMHAVRGAEESIALGEAYRRAWHQIGSLLWVAFLMPLVMLGAIVLAGIPALILFLLNAGLVALGVFLVLLVVFCITLSIWFCFSNLVVIDGVAQGMNAMLTSKALVRGRFWMILWRVVAIGLLLGIVVAIVAAIIGAMGLSQTGEALVEQTLSALFVTPIFMGALWTLYTNAKSSVDTTVHAKRTWIIALIVIGLIGIVVLPVVIGFAAVTRFLPQ